MRLIFAPQVFRARGCSGLKSAASQNKIIFYYSIISFLVLPSLFIINIIFSCLLIKMSSSSLLFVSITCDIHKASVMC